MGQFETQSYQKEKLKNKQAGILREKTNQQTNSNTIEAMNNRVTDSIEIGFQPSWVLEQTANHLALNALETEDEKWLEMIHYLTTQGGPEGGTSDLRRIGPNSYGKTLKGRTIIRETMKKLRAKQNARDKNAVTLFNLEQKTIKLNLTKEASKLFLMKDNSPEWNEKFMALNVKAANLGLSGVVKGEMDNINNIRSDFKNVDDNEMKDILKGMMMSEKGEDIFESDYHHKFMEMGVALTDKQEGDITSAVASIRDYDKIEEVVDAVTDGNTLIDDMIKTLEESYPDVTWGTSPILKQLITEQKRAIRDKIKDVYVDHLDRQKEIKPYAEWDKDGQEAFISAIAIHMKTVIPTVKDGVFQGEVYERLLKGFTDHMPPVTKQDKADRVKTLNAERSNIDFRASQNMSLPTDKNDLLGINKELVTIDLAGENKRKEEQEKAKIFSERRLLTAASGAKKDIETRGNLNKKLIEAAQLDKESGAYEIDTFITDSGLRLGKRLETKIKSWKENIVGPEETQVSKDMGAWYKGKLSSYFPGFLPGFLEGPLRFDRDRKLERVPEAAVTLVHRATKNARRLIERMMATEVKKQRRPYGLWKPEVKNTFSDKVELELKKRVFTRLHLARLKSMMPRNEMNVSPRTLYEDLDERPISSLLKEEVEKFHFIYITNGKATTIIGKAKELAKYLEPYMKSIGK